MTSLVYGYHETEEQAKSAFRKYWGTHSFPSMYGCFGSVQLLWNPKGDFYFGMPFLRGFSEMYVPDFNQFFHNMQISVLETRPYYSYSSGWSGETVTTQVPAGRAYREIEYTIFKLEYSKDDAGSFLYSDAARYYISIFVGETTRLYSSQFSFLEEADLKSVTSDFFMRSILASNEKLGKVYGTITSTKICGRIDPKKIKWLDQPERMNQIIVLNRLIPSPSHYGWGMPGHVRFSHCPYPSYMVNLMKRGKMKEADLKVLLP